MDLGLSGAKVLVTGATEGIGRSISEIFASEGCRIVIVARTRARLDELADRLMERGAPEVTIEARDVAAPGTAEALASAHPDLDVLVNNAGAIPGGAIDGITLDQWRQGWDLKVFGYIAMARAFFPRMTGRRRGVMINVIGASATGLDSRYIAGSTGNAALEALTHSLGSAGPDHGVRVVGVSPGMVLTSRLEGMLRNRARERFGDESRWAELGSVAAFGRPAQVEEIAASVVFLASPRSSYTSGAVLTIDGGFSRRHNWWG